MDNMILILYVGISNIRLADIDDYINKISNKILPTITNATIIVIPIDEPNTRIECINPKYITENELIIKNELLLFELNNKLEEQLNILKND